jgi:cell division ATPase FtsA
MSFSLGSSKEHDLILSIGSGSVYGAIAELVKHNPPVMVATYESKFPIKKGITSEALVSHMLGALHSVVTELGKINKKRVKTAHVVFASPWFSSVSKSLSVSHDEPFTVTEKIVSKLTEEHIASVLKDNRSGKSVIIEQALSDVKLNGYETLDPYGKEAKTLDISLYISSSPEEINKKIESEIYPVIHPGSIIFHTFPFVSERVVQNLFSPKDDFAFIDIGSEISDVVIVRRGSIHSLVSFPVGSNHLARNVAMHFETEPELASSIINLYATDTAEANVKEKMRGLVSAFAEEWGTGLLQAVKGEHNHDYFLPQRAFVASSPSTEKIFSDIISKQIPNVTGLTHENLAQFVRANSHDQPSVFMILEAIYLGVHFSGDIE